MGFESGREGSGLEVGVDERKTSVCAEGVGYLR
jgi:hypothetical protein